LLVGVRHNTGELQQKATVAIFATVQIANPIKESCRV
jgi:hypothetical protein